MNGKDLEKLAREWENPEKDKMVTSIEKKVEGIKGAKKAILQEIGKLEKLAKKDEDEALLDDLREARDTLDYLVEDISSVLESIRRSHAPEACNLLSVLDKSLGGLK